MLQSPASIWAPKELYNCDIKLRGNLVPLYHYSVEARDFLLQTVPACNILFVWNNPVIQWVDSKGNRVTRKLDEKEHGELGMTIVSQNLP